jgi:serine protease AprX
MSPLTTTDYTDFPSVSSADERALPVPLRMDADDRFKGRGVTIAFLDSGFYAHKDLTQPVNRIVAYHNIFSPSDDVSALETHDVMSWHGMMTSVVAAGNGFLSDGVFRGIAPAANLVLVKIGKTGRIPESDIEKGLRWVVANKDRYAIRIVNISAGGDYEQPYLQNTLCQLVEEAVAAGLTVVCAVGNAGLAPGHPVLPPASSPAAISVGSIARVVACTAHRMVQRSTVCKSRKLSRRESGLLVQYCRTRPPPLKRIFTPNSTLLLTLS